MSSISIRVNGTAKAVHVSSKRDDGLIDFPLCGAPGNTPAAARAFRPVETDDAVTCKRCIKIEDARLAAQIEAEIAEERIERERLIADVERFHGGEAAQLVRDGWTVDSAINHVSGSCDIELCTHPSHVEPSVDELAQMTADATRRATGSVSSTVVVERRELDGSLTEVARATSSRDDEPFVDIIDVEPTAMRIPVEQLRIGDVVFDVFGGEHEVVSVRLLKDGMRFVREDGDVGFWLRGNIATVKRA
jgi:hypothetical protein